MTDRTDGPLFRTNHNLNLKFKESDWLTRDATFCSGRGASPLLSPRKVLAPDWERWVSRLTLLVAAGR